MPVCQAIDEFKQRIGIVGGITVENYDSRRP